MPSMFRPEAALAGDRAGRPVAGDAVPVSEGFDPYVEAGREIQFYHSSTEDDRGADLVSPLGAGRRTARRRIPAVVDHGSSARALAHRHHDARIPELSRAMPGAYLEMNAQDARAAQIRNGDWVQVDSRRGTLRIQAWISGRGNPPPGRVFIPFFDETLLVNQLTLDTVDPFSKEPDYKKTAVRISKVTR